MRGHRQQPARDRELELRAEHPAVELSRLPSLNDDAVGPFDLSLALPRSASKDLRMFLVACGGSRRLERVDGQGDG